MNALTLLLLKSHFSILLFTCLSVVDGNLLRISNQSFYSFLAGRVSIYLFPLSQSIFSETTKIED